MVPLWYHNGVMANLTIKKLPDPVHRQLKKRAKLHGRSLNAQVIHMLQSDLSEHARFEKMRESNEELERLVASMPPMADSTPLIREDRDRDT
jgi:plasmid stability protein